MIYFRSDYSAGAHPKVLDALTKTNMEHADGYGLDVHCEHAAEMVKALIGIKDCSVHMMVGGTNCNITTVSAALRQYESVVAPRSGHLYFHETGALEAGGHRIATFPGVDGKLLPEEIDRAFDEYEDEHTLIPKMVYISFPTESGSIYSKAELEALSAKCKERNMYLYIDGARIASALTCDECDITLPELAQLCDAFYIGGTKNGALFGEALVIRNKEIDDHFRWMIKQKCGLLAKGRLIGVQFEALLEGGMDSVYFDMARETNRHAKRLREGLQELGCEFFGSSHTNQIFPILPAKVVKELEKDFFFYEWAPERDGKIPVRFVTSWATKESDVDALLEAVKRLLAE